MRERQGSIHRYVATLADEAGERREVELIEAPADYEETRRQAELLAEVRHAMLPTLHATWERDGCRYLAIERLDDGLTLADALAEGMSVEGVISVVLQLAQVLRRLHRAGWVLLGLTPEDVRSGQPIRLTRLAAASRIGDMPAHALHVPGYSAPELAQRTAITGKEGVYLLGAVLYHGLTGAPLPESGPELASLAAVLHIPGGPQLIAPALAPADERMDLEGFYRQLLAFKRRLALVPLALRVASGTTIGLNQTRLVNEDACGYVTWSVAYEGRVAYHALLCVIDGMGGMEAGEVASTAALRVVLRDAAAHGVGQIGDAVGSDRPADEDKQVADSLSTEMLAAVPAPRPLRPADLVQAAAEATYAAARGRQVGATITCAAIEDGRLTLAHVGDTRAYVLRDGALAQLTRDHSLVAAMVASGILTPAQARGHPESNKVLRSLGGQKVLPAGHIDGLTAAHGGEVLDLRDGDWLLLCSDGVWGVLDDEALGRILTEAMEPEAAVVAIIRDVLAGGAPDNAAVIVARCLAMPAS